ncbi:SDR family NAD(P)-dependent oxidoreductase [Salinispira pacifica]
MKIEFAERYGPWAVIAGGSRGVGAEFARGAAARGLNLVLIARNAEQLRSLKAEIEADYSVEVRTLPLDLSSRESLEAVGDAAESLDVGLLIHNTGVSNPGAFLERPVNSHLEQLSLNCAAPVALAHHFGAQMRARGRGGIILMASLTAFIGSPGVAGYGATKAFNLVLGESIHHELRSRGVDALVCCAGVIADRLTEADGQGGTGKRTGLRSLLSPPRSDPRSVSETALESLGRRAVVVPGRFNRAVAFSLQHLMPRPVAARLMGWTARGLEFPADPQV